jgi:hypothetical protein
MNAKIHECTWPVSDVQGFKLAFAASGLGWGGGVTGETVFGAGSDGSGTKTASSMVGPFSPQPVSGSARVRIRADAKVLGEFIGALMLG